MSGDPAVPHYPCALPLVQRVGAIAWPSFFSACVMTMVFFAFVDPLTLRDILVIWFERVVLSILITIPIAMLLGFADVIPG